MAGGRCKRLCRPALSSALYVLHGALAPGVFLLGAVDAEEGLLEEGVISDPASAWASNISGSVIPAWRRGSSTSVLHQSVSVSAIRRRLSAQTRSHPR